MLYATLKDLISNSYFPIEDIKNKLGVFYFCNQLSEEHYKELLNMVESQNPTSSETSNIPNDDNVKNNQKIN